MLVIIALVVMSRVRLLGLPLERDEGEYAYAGQLLLQGVPPYTAAYNMKLPGTYAAYAAIMAAFGQTETGIRLGLLVVNLATAWLVFLAGRRIADASAGATAAATFAVLSASPAVMGMWAHATHFVALCAMAGTLALLVALENGRWWQWLLSGLGFGAALVMKQHGVFFVLVGVAALVRRWRKQQPASTAEAAKAGGCYLLGAATPLALTCLVVALAGAWDRFWFWTVVYAGQYASHIPLADGVWLLAQSAARIIAAAPLPTLLALAGLWWLTRSEAAVRHRLTVFALLATSFLSVCPGFYFREHYFIPLVPAAALLAGIAGRALLHRFGGRSCAAAVAAGVASPLLLLGGFHFTWPAERITRAVFTMNPFLEAREVAAYLRAHTEPGDRIAVLGSEPQIYFLAGRRSATGHIYAYGLMEPHPHALAMQKELALEVERAQPAFVVLSESPASWRATEQSERWMLGWINEFIPKHYELAGIARQDQRGHVTLDWAKPGRQLSMGPHTLLVYRRRPPPQAR